MEDELLDARMADHRKGDPASVGWAQDAIRLLQRFVKEARGGRVNVDLLLDAAGHIESAQEDME